MLASVGSHRQEERRPPRPSRRLASKIVRPVRRRWWELITALLIVVGTSTSFFLASALADDASDKSAKAFAASASEIAARLQLAIQHEQDLVIAAGALFIANPQTTETQFKQWLTSTAAFTRYPELQGISELALVPASALSAFETKEQRDPPGLLSSTGAYRVSPPGLRPFYCLEAVSGVRSPSLALPAGIDYCDGSVGSLFIKARDTGVPLYIPYNSKGVEGLGLGSAIYTSGSVPSTQALRESSTIGWTGVEVLPGQLLATALANHPATAVQFHYGSGSSRVTFKAGSAPAHPHTSTTYLHNGWRVETLGAVQGAGILSDRNAVSLLVAGTIASFLLSALVLLLGTGRARAKAKLEQRTSELRFQALHDPLTGLPNRALLNDRIALMLARCHRSGAPMAAMFIDLDDFKEVNDTLGHSVGDEVLRAVASRLASATRDGDTIGRLGGDEFLLLVEGSSLNAGAEMVADRILETLASPFDIEGCDFPISVSASIGIATNQWGSADELLRDADIALYQAKGTGKCRAVVFTSTMHAARQDHRTLAQDLRVAFESEQLFLLYQPTIDLESGTFTGVEALLRWQHPERGVVLPCEFIPAMETSGVIIPVGAWVLEEACRQGAAWQSAGHRVTMSVNVSAKQLEHDRIYDDVRLALLVSELNPADLILELTETTLMSITAETMARIEQLKSLGIRIAVDDFGTGYSSLSYLRKFPIDIMKIDRSFVTDMTNSTEAAAFVHTLVQLGKALSLETIAEGIEDDDQRFRLQAEEVDTGQGFLFSRPLPADVIGQFLGNAPLRARSTEGASSS
jgi:diguanylate cyclase (GGDEF)-like protein